MLLSIDWLGKWENDRLVVFNLCVRAGTTVLMVSVIVLAGGVNGGISDQ